MTKPIQLTETKLKKIAQLSRGDSNFIFNGLMPHINKEFLIDCFNKLDGKKAVGVDGRTKDDYGKNLDDNIMNLVTKIKSMSYRPVAVKEVKISKDGSKNSYRTLGISIFEEKIVQMAMARILNAIYEPIFEEVSYGFRANKSCHKTIIDLDKHLFKE